MISEILESYVSVSDPRSITARFEESFDKAVELLVNETFDILVLDIRDESGVTPSDEEGIRVFDEIRRRCFIPIIFYTALPNASISVSSSPFVQTVSKIAAEPILDMEEAVENVISSGLPRLLQSVSSHLADVERVFMADFVEQNWSDLVDRPEDMAYLLSRRLAVSFDEEAESLATELGQAEETVLENAIHPTRYYVQPLHSSYKMGDLVAMTELTEEDMETERLHVVLTPSCDLVSRAGNMNADSVVLLRCFLLDDFKEYQDWVNAPSANKEKLLRKLLTSRPKGQEDRYRYLPAAWNVPDCVVDLQSVTSISYEELTSCRKIASLDSPFAEALSYQFNRYIGRVGIPDLDIDGILRRLKR